MTSSDPESSTKAPIDGRCERCQAPVQIVPGYPPVCDDCYPLYGACCQEWDGSQEAEPQPDKS